VRRTDFIAVLVVAIGLMASVFSFEAHISGRDPAIMLSALIVLPRERLP